MTTFTQADLDEAERKGFNAGAMEQFVLTRKEIVALLRDLKNRGLERATTQTNKDCYEDAWHIAALLIEKEGL